ncbi:MvdC/MvdD family ATP grasp protein [Desulfovibrio piger]|uniref:MvdC/MvdD family ATP grasp protein n=1 Tax=Desulfovibrio piger TaxID=901 RepID=UPI001958381D|nr:hypothetical protein [Desulfovibrio piger]MBM6836103.1 hypothetical protein [Desulfovibrio piger]
MNKTILILTDKFDSHADRVQMKISEQGIVTFRLNLDVESLKTTKITEKCSTWYIQTDCGEISSNEIDGIFLRRAFVELMLDEYDSTDIGFKIWRNEWNKVLLGLYTALREKIWINRLKYAQIAENKFYQYHIAKQCDLNLPNQIVSNEIDQLKLFIEENGVCVVKTLAQEFYKDNDGVFKGLYVNKINVDSLNEFGDNENPITIQKYYDKLYEVRYTVVGDEHFVCKIESQKSLVANVDWRRYDIANTPHVAMIPPDAIREKVSSLMELLGLSYGAIDFIVTKENDWVFLEINPLGQWLWIEDLTGLDISGGIARFFTKIF